MPAEHIFADRAYDTDHLVDKNLDQGGEVVIPPRRHRRFPHVYDKAIYKERNRVERFFSRIKQCRHIATRYDKIAHTFMGFIRLACIMLWLK